MLAWRDLAVAARRALWSRTGSEECPEHVLALDRRSPASPAAALAASNCLLTTLGISTSSGPLETLTAIVSVRCPSVPARGSGRRSGPAATVSLKTSVGAIMEVVGLRARRWRPRRSCPTTEVIVTGAGPLETVSRDLGVPDRLRARLGGGAVREGRADDRAPIGDRRRCTAGSRVGGLEAGGRRGLPRRRPASLPTTPSGNAHVVGALGHGERDGAVLADAVALAGVGREDLADRVPRRRTRTSESAPRARRASRIAVASASSWPTIVGTVVYAPGPCWRYHQVAAADERGEDGEQDDPRGARWRVRRRLRPAARSAPGPPTPRPIGSATVVPAGVAGLEHGGLVWSACGRRRPGVGRPRRRRPASASRSVSSGSVAAGQHDGRRRRRRAGRGSPSSRAARVRRSSASAAPASTGRSSGSRAASARTSVVHLDREPVDELRRRGDVVVDVLERDLDGRLARERLAPGQHLVQQDPARRRRRCGRRSTPRTTSSGAR